MEEEVTGTVSAVSEVATTAVEHTKTLLHFDQLQHYLTLGNLIKIVISLLTIFIFYIAYRIIKNFFNKQNEKRIKANTLMIVNKVFSYIFWILIAMYVLNLFGIKLSAIWGAAGIAGVAIGFAAQTSVSNIISGVFVLGEKAMKIGDYISVAGESGVVHSIGLLSVKIKTLDNQIIRIPNSTIINSNLENYNTFPIRRLVFEIPISYDCDLEKALTAMQKVPSRCNSVLQDPAALVYYDGFGDSGVNLRLAVWFKSEDLIQIKNEVYINVTKVCKEDNVVIPFMRYEIKILDDNKTPVTIKKAAVKKNSANVKK